MTTLLLVLYLVLGTEAPSLGQEHSNSKGTASTSKSITQEEANELIDKSNLTPEERTALQQMIAELKSKNVQLDRTIIQNAVDGLRQGNPNGQNQPPQNNPLQQLQQQQLKQNQQALKQQAQQQAQQLAQQRRDKNGETIRKAGEDAIKSMQDALKENEKKSSGIKS